MRNKHVVVMGGGFAGLRAAVAFADAGMRITVLEGRNNLGGRARSFIDPATGEVVDNGQHLFLSGYRETMQFLERLGTQRDLVFQKRLRVTFVEPGGRMSTMDCPPLVAPWHLIFGVARLSSLSLSDKLGFRRVSQAVASYSSGNGSSLNSLDEETVESWLTRLGQSPRSRSAFWYPLAIAALNEDPSKASALGLVSVLRTLMNSPWPNSRLGMASVGLSDLYTTAAQKIIEEKNGQVYINRPVVRLRTQGNRISAVECADGTVIEADAVVSTLPPSSLSQILPDAISKNDAVLGSLNRFTTSPIVSINLWFDMPFTRALFVGFIGTKVQWLFNKEAILARAGVEANYVTLIVSAAHDFIHQPKEALVSMAMEDLRLCFPKKTKTVNLIFSQVVREQKATVSLTVGMEKIRPGPCTCFSNFFLAGDWTATGLPATIESAVLSGRICAEAVLTWLTH